MPMAAGFWASFLSWGGRAGRPYGFLGKIQNQRGLQTPAGKPATSASDCWGSEGVSLATSRFLSDLSPKDVCFPRVVSKAFNYGVLTELLPVGSGRDDVLPCGSEDFCAS